MIVSRGLFLITTILCAQGLAQSRPSTQFSDGPVTALVISADGSRVIAGSHNEIRVYVWEDLSQIKSVELSFASVHDVDFDTSTSQLVVVGGSPGESGDACRLSWPELRLIDETKLADDVVYSACPVSNVSMWAIAGHDHAVYLQRIEPNTRTTALVGHSKVVTDVVTVKGTNLLLSCSEDQTIRVWNPGTKTIVRSLSNHIKAVRMMAVRPQEPDALPMLASVSDDKTVRFWQPTIGRLVRFKRLGVPASTVTWSCDGQTLIVGCRDGSVRFIDPDSLEMTVADVDADSWISELAAHPTRQFVVVGTTEGQIRKLSIPQI